MIDITLPAVVVTAVVIALSGLIIRFAYRAAKRSHSRSLRLFAGGFTLITLGTLAGGLVAVSIGLDPMTGLFLQGVVMLLGLALLLKSLYTGPISIRGPRINGR